MRILFEKIHRAKAIFTEIFSERSPMACPKEKLKQIHQPYMTGDLKSVKAMNLEHCPYQVLGPYPGFQSAEFWDSISGCSTGGAGEFSF
jgi:hypothetical protein